MNYVLEYHDMYNCSIAQISAKSSASASFPARHGNGSSPQSMSFFPGGWTLGLFITCSLRLGRETQLEVAAVKDCELGLEEDIAIDSERESSRALQATEAHGGVVKRFGIDGGVLHEVTSNDSLVGANVERQVGECRVTRKDVAANIVVVYSVRDLGIVCLGDFRRYHQQRGTRVSDGLVRGGGRQIGDSVGVGLKLPEAASLVYVDEVEVAMEFGLVNETEVV